jgi:hypothetical protein
MIGSPSPAPAPTLAWVWRKSWMRTPLRPARLATAAHGRLRSARACSPSRRALALETGNNRRCQPLPRRKKLGCSQIEYGQLLGVPAVPAPGRRAACGNRRPEALKRLENEDPLSARWGPRRSGGLSLKRLGGRTMSQRVCSILHRLRLRPRADFSRKGEVHSCLELTGCGPEFPSQRKRQCSKPKQRLLPTQGAGRRTLLSGIPAESRTAFV